MTDLGNIHLDKATGRLLIDGVPVCTGCGRPCDTRFCCDVCEVKRSAELRLLRIHLLPILLWAQMPEHARAVADPAIARNPHTLGGSK
jgi:hypothetical protein